MNDKMTSFSAKSRKADDAPRLVVFVVYPDIVLLDLVGPLQVFTHALDPETGANGYDCAVTSFDGGIVETNTVVSIPSEPMSRYLNRQIHTLVVVGGDGANNAMRDRALLEKITKFSSGAERVCSVCSGALVLAATGILDGRRAVTHWDDCNTLEVEFPAVRVEIDPIYIKDDHVWTSAGITAGMDMALAIVAEDLGRPSALQIARSMVTHMVRSGGQSQFSPVLGRQLLDATGRFEELHPATPKSPACPSRASGWPSLTTLWGFPCCLRFPCVHAAATTPVQRLGVIFAHLAQPCQPSPKGSSGRPAHRPFRGLLGIHSRCGLHTRSCHLFVAR